MDRAIHGPIHVALRRALHLTTEGSGNDLTEIGVDVGGDDINGIIDGFYYLNQSSQSVNVNFILPANPVVGSTVGVATEDGNSDYSIGIQSGASGHTINGVSVFSSPFTYIYTAGETLVFRAISTTAWAVEYDGRICGKVEVDKNGTDITTNTNNVWTLIDFGTVRLNIGNNWDTTNKRLTPRRESNWAFELLGEIHLPEGGAQYIWAVLLSSGISKPYYRSVNTSNTVRKSPLVVPAIRVARAANVIPYFRTGLDNKGLNGDVEKTFMTAYEIL